MSNDTDEPTPRQRIERQFLYGVITLAERDAAIARLDDERE